MNNLRKLIMDQVAVYKQPIKFIIDIIQTTLKSRIDY